MGFRIFPDTVFCAAFLPANPDFFGAAALRDTFLAATFLAATFLTTFPVFAFTAVFAFPIPFLILRFAADKTFFTGFRFPLLVAEDFICLAIVFRFCMTTLCTKRTKIVLPVFYWEEKVTHATECGKQCAVENEEGHLNPSVKIKPT